MSTALASPAEMIRLGAPRVIHNDQELAEYTRALFALTAKDEQSVDEMDAIELLTLLIKRYEGEQSALPKAEPCEVLRYLMERNGLTQRDLMAEFGAESTVSLVLSGKRLMNRTHMARLSARFGVSPAVFFGL